MATFDQLPADQRAIIELVVRRGRSYEALADVLEIPPQRVRELARDALAELSPVTATRVDSDWRGQLADYLLGQQSGPESTATRGHLKRSEAARAWAFSLLDSLDPLYENGTRPLIPEPDDSNGRGRRGREEAAVVDRPRERDRRERERERSRERERDEERSRAEKREREERKEREREEKRERKEKRERDAALSPEARRAVRRRRILGGVGAVAGAAIIAVAVLAATGSFSSSKPKHKADATAAAQILGEVPLNAVGNSGDRGIAVIAQRGGQRELVVQASVKQNQPGYAYEVWLYNSPTDVQSLGAQVPQQGTLQGAGQLPANFARFKYIDISYEKVGSNTGHNGQSVMRGAFADIQAPPSQGSGSTTPGQTSPGQGTPGQATPPQTTPTP